MPSIFKQARGYEQVALCIYLTDIAKGNHQIPPEDLQFSSPLCNYISNLIDPKPNTEDHLIWVEKQINASKILTTAFSNTTNWKYITYDQQCAIYSIIGQFTITHHVVSPFSSYDSETDYFVCCDSNSEYHIIESAVNINEVNKKDLIKIKNQLESFIDDIQNVIDFL